MMESLTATTCIRKDCDNLVENFGDLQCRSCNPGSVVQKRTPLEIIAGSSVLPISTPKPISPNATMTEPEKRMAVALDERKRAGELQAWWFEAITFRVGIERCRYTPDFVALLADGSLEVIEVKGEKKWDDAIVKFKAAVLEYPIARWRMLEYAAGEWRTLHDWAPMATNVQ